MPIDNIYDPWYYMNMIWPWLKPRKNVLLINIKEDNMALPAEKKDKLADRVADAVYKTCKENHNEFTKHEIQGGDSQDIVVRGVERGKQRFLIDTQNPPPAKKSP